MLATYKINTATGPDGVSSQMIRGTVDSITPTITAIFNQSLKEMKVPDDWKIANVTPVFKAGDPSLATNYRPISLLSLISKVLERIVHSKVSNYLKVNRLLANCQFGFRKGSSTQEALLKVINDWHQLLSSNKHVAAVFFDVRKAFDSVPHTNLIQSLMSVGIDEALLGWFSDYLVGRKQRVVLEGQSF